jgi:hypothetical protein
MSDSDENPARLSDDQRFALLERDSRDHAKTLSTIVDKIGKGFTDEQMAQLRAAFRDELADAGLRIDGPEHVDDAREDFRFLRRLRLIWDSSVSKVGSAVLTALVGVAFIIIGAGFWAWLSQNIHK